MSKPRKVSGIIRSELKDLQTRISDGINLSLTAREGEVCPSSNSKAGQKGRIPVSSTLCSNQVLYGLNDAHTGEGNLLY